MNSNQITPEDLALFAMQLLTPEESAQVIQLLENDEEARAELAQIQGDLAIYAMSSELQTPSADARERLMRRVAKEKKLVPKPEPVAVAAPAAAVPAVTTMQAATPHEEPYLLARTGARVFSIEDEPRRSNKASILLAVAGWAVAAGVAAFAVTQYHQREALQNSIAAQNARLDQAHTQASEAARAQTIVQTLTAAGALQAYLHVQGPAANASSKTPKPEGHAAYLADSGQLVFTASHLTPLKDDKTYELWLIPSDGEPMPAGTFKPDAQGFATVVLPQLPKGVTAKSFGVTIENDGGSTTPTPPIVLAGM